MLNPPLSLLSDDLLSYIVDRIANHPFGDESLKKLSLADRAFTQSCQKYIFRDLKLWDGKVTKKLKKLKKILDDKPLFANKVRRVELCISRSESGWLFEDDTFVSILQLLANSPVPPNELYLAGRTAIPLTFEDPIIFVRQLTQSFFPQSLTILRLKCAGVPSTLFLAFPRLIDLDVDIVKAIEKSYDKYPDNQCSGRDAPQLEVFGYRNSHSIVEQMITPPPRFNTPVVLWSKLRVLTLTPHERVEVACLQPILDAACFTLEELYLTDINMNDSKQIPLAGLVNLSKLSNLQVFCLCVIISCKPPRKAPRKTPPPEVLHDIATVLGTIPVSNKVTNLWLDFDIAGKKPFRGCLDQDWVGIFNEIIRISDGKPLELELQFAVSTDDFLETEFPGQDDLFERIMEKATPLLDYPKICTHSWNPTFWARGIKPFPRGQVRSRCRK